VNALVFEDIGCLFRGGVVGRNPPPPSWLDWQNFFHCDLATFSLQSRTMLMSLLCIINMHSRSHNREFSHSCHWSMCRFNHSPKSVILKAKKIKFGGRAWLPSNSSTGGDPRRRLWHLHLGTYGASAVKPLHWEFLSMPLEDIECLQNFKIIIFVFVIFFSRISFCLFSVWCSYLC